MPHADDLKLKPKVAKIQLNRLFSSEDEIKSVVSSMPDTTIHRIWKTEAYCCEVLTVVKGGKSKP